MYAIKKGSKYYTAYSGWVSSVSQAWVCSSYEAAQQIAKEEGGKVVSV